jgi:hypothetical protein
LAEVTPHIPEPGEHLIRYSGFYSNPTFSTGGAGQQKALKIQGSDLKGLHYISPGVGPLRNRVFRPP